MEWTLERLRPRPKLNSPSSDTYKEQNISSKIRKRKKTIQNNNKTNENFLEIITKEIILKITKEINPFITLDNLVEQLLIEMIESFIESVIKGSSLLAMHRKGKTVDTKDVQLYLSLHISEQSYKKFKELISKNRRTEKMISIHKIIEHY